MHNSCQQVSFTKTLQDPTPVLCQLMYFDLKSDVSVLFSEYLMPVGKVNIEQAVLKKQLQTGRQTEICIK